MRGKKKQWTASGNWMAESEELNRQKGEQIASLERLLKKAKEERR